MGSTPGIEIDEIFQRLQNAYTAYSKDPTGNMKAKALLRSTALELSTAVQAPHEVATAFAMSNAIFPCYRAAGECGILSIWPKETMSANELAEKTGADPRLIGELIERHMNSGHLTFEVRLMRVLLASGVFKEVGEDVYSHNKLSATLSIPAFLGMVKFTYVL
jgi:hypothetical protein